jgi:hypothetical protein
MVGYEIRARACGRSLILVSHFSAATPIYYTERAANKGFLLLGSISFGLLALVEIKKDALSRPATFADDDISTCWFKQCIGVHQ